MRFFDYIRIAFKNLWRQKLRSILTIIAVVIGATAVISLVSLVLGFSNVFMSQMEAVGAFTQVAVTASTEVEDVGPFSGGRGGAEESGKKLDDNTVKLVEDIDHVVAASPVVYVHSLETMKIEGGEKKFRTNTQAYTPNKASEKTLSAGRNFNSDNVDGKVIIGRRFLKGFGYEDDAEGIIGKKIIFTTYKGYSGEGAEIPGPNAQKEDWDAFQEKITEIKAEIIGVTIPGPEEGSLYIPLEWGRKIMTHKWWEVDQEAKEQLERQGKLQGPPPMELHTQSEIEQRGYSYLLAKVDDANNVEAAAEEIKKHDLGAITAKDFLDSFLRILSIVGIVLGSIGGIALFVAAIGIINTMIMAIYERTREIGVMRACGARRSTVRRLFTFEATLIGFWGGVFGVLAGIGLSKVANIFANRSLESQGMSAENIISLPWWLILGTIGFTMIIGLVSGLYPAHRAAKLDPVEALRYE